MLAVRSIKRYSFAKRKGIDMFRSFRLKRNLAKLGNDDWQVRKSAAVALGELADTETVDRLVYALEDSCCDVRTAVADALAKLGDARAVSSLIGILCDENDVVRSTVAKALSKLGEEQWDEMVKGGPADFERLAGCHDIRSAEPFIKAFNRGSPSAAAGLLKVGGPAWEVIISAFGRADNVWKRNGWAKVFRELWKVVDLRNTAMMPDDKRLSAVLTQIQAAL